MVFFFFFCRLVRGLIDACVARLRLYWCESVVWVGMRLVEFSKGL